MRPVAYLGSACTATFSPYGRCVTPVIGRIISAATATYINGKPVARAYDSISYAGLIFPFTGGGPTYVTWIGRVLPTGKLTLVENRPIATIGDPTDSGGYIIEGENTIYA